MFDKVSVKVGHRSDSPVRCKTIFRSFEADHVTKLGSAASGRRSEAILVDDVHELFHRISVN